MPIYYYLNNKMLHLARKLNFRFCRNYISVSRYFYYLILLLFITSVISMILFLNEIRISYFNLLDI